MTDEQLKAAERRGYNKGYLAGKRRKQRESRIDHERRERQAFIDRVFLAVLPTAMDTQGWKFGDKPITSTADRVELARRWAIEALSKRPKA